MKKTLLGYGSCGLKTSVNLNKWKGSVDNWRIWDLGNNNRQCLLSKTWAATFTCEIETSMGQLTEGIPVIKEVGNSEQASVYIVWSDVLPLEYVAQSRQHWSEVLWVALVAGVHPLGPSPCLLWHRTPIAVVSCGTQYRTHDPVRLPGTVHSLLLHILTNLLQNLS